MVKPTALLREGCQGFDSANSACDSACCVCVGGVLNDSNDFVVFVLFVLDVCV